MAVIRVEKTKNYTGMSNHHLRDKNLSLRAKGLLSFMLSLPEGWDYSEMGLAACLKENRGAIRTVLKELEDCRYLSRDRERKANGTLGGTIYTVYEKPMAENPTQVKTASGKADEPLENKETPSNGLAESPMLEKPMLENRTQINTKVTNKEEKDIYIGQRTAEKEKNQEPEGFDVFWKEYPRKQKKKEALKVFTKLKPSAELLEKMIAALRKQKQSEQWQNKKYIPHPPTWLNGERWEDDLGETELENKSVSQMSREEYLRMIAERNRQDEERRQKELI
jgi:hypothetical protein